MFEMQTRLHDEWKTICIPDSPGLAVPPPYRYDYAADAKRTLDNLHPNLPADRKRVVGV